MGPLTVAAFFIACLFGVGYPSLSTSLCLSLFPLKQLMQASSGFFRDTLLGSQVINVVIGLAAAIAVIRQTIRNPEQFRGYITSSLLLTIGLYCWGVTTCLWSYAGTEGLASFSSAIPYIILYLFIVPALIPSLDTLCRVIWAWLLLNTCLSALILMNPEFTSWAGRLVLNLGVAGLKITKTNPLEIGAAGGICIILGVLYQGARLKTLVALVRLAAVLLGTVLVIRSGSRGQFLFAIVASIVAYPAARQVTDFRRAALALVGLGIVVVIILLIAERVRSSGTSDEERRWASEGFESGSNVRGGNIVLLLGEFASSPGRWLTGLGFQSYYSLDPTQEYSHCIAVDALAELGLIGAALFVAIFAQAAWLFRQVFDQVRDSSQLRNGLGCLLAILLFYFLIANKQGNLTGSPALFGFVLMLARIHRAQPQSEASGEQESLGTEHGNASPGPARAGA